LLNEAGRNPLTIEEAREYLKEIQYFDYLRGRVLKIALSTNTLRTVLYDRDNGHGAALRALEPLLRRQHAENHS
jgi:hypothetical protein